MLQTDVAFVLGQSAVIEMSMSIFLGQTLKKMHEIKRKH